MALLGTIATSIERERDPIEIIWTRAHANNIYIHFLFSFWTKSIVLFLLCSQKVNHAEMERESKRTSMTRLKNKCNTHLVWAAFDMYKIYLKVLQPYPNVYIYYAHKFERVKRVYICLTMRIFCYVINYIRDSGCLNHLNRVMSMYWKLQYFIMVQRHFAIE